MVKPPNGSIVICGAGIAGIAAAYHLAVKHKMRDVVLVDPLPPLSLTSDKSTECYRNWWPGPGDTMVQFMNRSIDLLEALAWENDNYFHMNRRGYVFMTADPGRAMQFRESAESISRLGAGELRIHDGLSTDAEYPPLSGEGFSSSLGGADLLLDPALIQTRFPFLTKDTIALLHPRRCGWLSAQQLGMYLLREAKSHGARLVTGRISDVSLENGRVHSVQLDSGDGSSQLRASAFVIAAGPLLNDVAKMIGLELPVFNELHGKVVIEDYLGVVPRDLPLMIWSDPITLPWSEEERLELARDEETRWLTQEFPAGVHFRPEGGAGAQTLLMLWTYHLEAMEPVWPLPPFEAEYPEILLRGLSRMIPGLSVYFDKMSKPELDGGYYCKTRENRPLIGPLPVEGAYVIGALSGYGIMASMAAGELLASHIGGGRLPDYAPAFLLERYDDPAYLKLLESWDATSGQL
jgi:glycine/D-amino acid oxidase-like deaminating enzyme